MRGAASTPWCGSALIAPYRYRCAHSLVIDALWPRLAFAHCRLTVEARHHQVPADVHASEVVDSTLAEPVAAAAALGSAARDSGCVQSDSEVPALCTVTAFCCALRAMP